MIIDVHYHPFCKEADYLPDTEESIKRMMSKETDPVRHENMAAMTSKMTELSIHDLVKDMDDAGVDKVCAVAMDLSSGWGIKMVTNENVSRFAEIYPDRVIPFASVDPSMGQQAIDELTYAVEKLGCRGLKLVPPLQFFDISDPKHFPLWQRAQDLGIVVWTHVSHQVSTRGSDARLGAPMLLEPVALEFPEMKLVLGHCGFPWVWETWSLIARHKNVYLDLSAYHMLYNHMPWDAYTKFGVEHKLLFATDYPIADFKTVLDAIDQLDISDEFKTKIKGENAARLLGLNGS